MKTGPNDAQAITEFFFFSFLFSYYLLLQIGTTCVLKGRKGSWEPAMTNTGPNDALCVVWAISEFFFFFLSYFLILTITYRSYMSFKGSERVMGAGDDENGPKRRFVRRLGH